ncbi:MAG: SufS family cysteine desulfurase, partial [Fibrobacterales bacterium]|nr:SufS family cysteine desulfurase [Fibrobacterales bacterium]
MNYDVESIRAQFPVLSRKMGDKPLAYLDSTATTQKPLCVIEAMDDFYRNHYSSVKRGVYRLSEWTTSHCEATRAKVAEFLGASSPDEIVFTRGTTESLNLVAQSWGRKNVRAGDAILLGALEHHADIVPWQILAEEKGAEIRVIPCDDDANLLLDAVPGLLADGKVKIVCVNQVANTTGTVNPVAEIAKLAHEAGALMCVDGAQSVAHLDVDVARLGCDFFAFSGHKIYGPTGIGVLWARSELLEAMPPWHGGGEMIDQVTFAKTTYAPPPARFEAGTPPIAEIIGLGFALDWVRSVGLAAVAEHEAGLLADLRARLGEMPGIRLIGSPRDQSAIQSFVMEGIHAHDAALILDEEGIAVRAGHHCAQPVMERFGVPATIRVSYGAYSVRKETDQLVSALARVRRIF